jgi:hypothetical protein
MKRNPGKGPLQELSRLRGHSLTDLVKKQFPTLGEMCRFSPGVPTMTDPAPENTALWVTDAEIIRRMGVGINSGRKALQQMRQHPKFPPRSIGGKTYWPSAVDFFDFWNGRRVDVPPIPAGQAHVRISHTGRRRPGLEATEEWLGCRVGRAAAGLPPPAK